KQHPLSCDKVIRPSRTEQVPMQEVELSSEFLSVVYKHDGQGTEWFLLEWWERPRKISFSCWKGNVIPSTFINMADASAEFGCDEEHTLPKMADIIRAAAKKALAS